MARLLADADFPNPVLMELRRLGHDAISLGEAGLAHRWGTDDEVLSAAKNDGRALLTLDLRSFAQLIAGGADHPVVIACMFDADFAGMARRIDQALSTSEKPTGRIIRIGRRRPASA